MDWWNGGKMDANQAGPRDYDAPVAISGWGDVVLVTAVTLVELVLLQAFTVGVTTGIYYLVPLLAVGEPQGFADWRSIFQVVSATVTLPGGGVIVLSIYLMARRAQQAERRAAAIAEKAAADVAAAEERAEAIQAEYAALKARLERRPRRRRRPLRS